MNSVFKWVLILFGLAALAGVAVVYAMLSAEEIHGGIQPYEPTTEPSQAPAPSIVPAPEAAEPLSVPELLKEEKALLRLGSGKMKKLRAGTRQELEQCVSHMREAHARAEELARQADALGLEFFHLKAGANHMPGCVSCVPERADFDCKEAKKMLAEFEKSQK